MGLIVEKCEHCTANLEYEEGANEVVCEYCGCKKIINNSVNTANSIFNPIIGNPIVENKVEPIPNTNSIIGGSSIISNNVENNSVVKEEDNVSNNINVEEIKETTSIVDNATNITKKKPKKRKKNIKKLLLYFFFTALIITSGVIYYLDYQKKEKEPEIFDSLPSEIIVDDKDKTEFTIDKTVYKLAPDVDLNAERTKYKNNDIIGRLEIPNLFNVLVVKGTDNSYYLSHSVKKEADIRGTEFIDYRVSPTSKQVNVYGHNTRDSRIKVAFLKLEQFLKKEFFDNNPYIVFQHDSGKDFYKIIAIKEIRSTNNEHMYVEYTGSTFVEHIKSMTTGEGVYNTRAVTYDENSEIIVLQTCSHHWDNGFYIITAVKVK